MSEQRIWTKMDGRRDASLFPLFLTSEAMTAPMQNALGVSHSAVMICFKKGEWNYYEVKGEFENSSKRIIERLRREPDFFEKAVEETYARGAWLLEFTQRIFEDDLRKRSNQELLEYYLDYCTLLKDMRGFAAIAPAMDHTGYLTETLMQILRKRAPEKAVEYFAVLTEPRKRTQGRQQDCSLLEIAAKISQTPEYAALFEKPLEEILARLPAHPELDAAFAEHEKKYGWLPCTYEGEPWNKHHFISIARELLASKANPVEELEAVTEKERIAEQKRSQALSKLNLTAEERALFDVASEVIFFKADRKDIFFKSYFQTRRLLEEIGARTGLSLQQVRFMLPAEVKAALLEGKKDAELFDARREFSVVVSENDETRVLLGAEAKAELVKVEQRELSQARGLKGTCASPGYAKGIAKIVLTPADMAKFNKGDVLVAQATNPDIVMAMKKAAAIVTNTGGLTCHAAIVSRELGIPCLVGTGVATDVISDGDFVEVDATNGKVRKVD
ncbi:MAG: PEP-utilizing enzyme [Candidatus Micrarchaeota archaeon]